MRCSVRLSGRTAATLVLFATAFGGEQPSGADDVIAERADVREAIRKGRNYLTSTFDGSQKTYHELIAYALLKSGGTEADPIIKGMIDKIIKRVHGEEYKKPPSGDRMYVVGLEAMILSDAGSEKYVAELEIIRDYIIEQQNDDGSWSYTKNLKSDVSVTQYAVLGLWAAQRAGAEVPEEVWGKIALFHIRAQLDNGGYPYEAFSQTRATMNMTAAAVGTMAIAQMHLPESRRKETSRPQDEGVAAVGADGESVVATAEPVVRYGILYPVDEQAEREAEERRKQEETEAAKQRAEEQKQNAERQKPDAPQVVAGAVDGPLSRAGGFMNQTFAVINDNRLHTSYWFYTLERAASLTNRQSVGGQDWYNACADAILTWQEGDGHWRLPQTWHPAEGDTAFILLFLSRPTAKFADFKPPADRLAGGLLAGGRGLPSDLTQYGKPEKKGPQTGLEKLLADLSEAETTDLPDLQEKLVEQIQVADREELIGQTDTLVKLVEHENPEIRRTVLWAIGRTGDLRLARYPLKALDDANLGVLTEARNALAWIARTPDAKGFPEDPLEGVPPGSPSSVRLEAIEKWREGMWDAWGRWYLERSPYEDRFDEFELDLRARLGRR